MEAVADQTHSWTGVCSSRLVEACGLWGTVAPLKRSGRGAMGDCSPPSNINILMRHYINCPRHTCSSSQCRCSSQPYWKRFTT